MEEKTKRKVSVARRQSVLIIDKNFKVRMGLLWVLHDVWARRTGDSGEDL